jgi:hypothetical protein
LGLGGLRHDKLKHIGHCFAHRSNSDEMASTG